jgi:hypothetical protein
MKLRIKEGRFFESRKDYSAWKLVKASDAAIVLVDKWNNEKEITKEEFKSDYVGKVMQNWL